MDLFNRTELRRLAESQDDVCISLYMPMYRNESDWSQNTTRLKNLLREARNQLREQDFREELIDDILADARALLDRPGFWRNNIGEGLALAFAGVVGFAVLKKPLAKIGGKVPDIDALYNPAAFYGTRALVVGVTETYAAVDRTVVGGVETAIWIVHNPDAVAMRIESATPPWILDIPGDGQAVPAGYLRASIGTGILLLSVVISVGLALAGIW